MPGLKENTRYCQSIVEDLKSFAETGAYVCPECGGFTYYDSETDSFKCDCCNEVRIISEYPDAFYTDEKTGDHLYLEDDCATDSWWDYFSDVYATEYRLAADRQTLKSVKLCIAVGGPDIFIDTGDNLVKLYWHGEYAEAYIPSYVSDQITEAFEELYHC